MKPSHPESTSCGTKCSAAVRAGRSVCAVRQFIIVAVFIFAADLAIKHFAFKNIVGQSLQSSNMSSFDEHLYEPAVLIANILSLKLTLNHGAVFGMGQGGRWIFVLVSIIAVFVIGFVFARSDARARWLNAALALVLGGALGNLYDRLVFGAVRDMFWLFPEMKLPFGLHWPGGGSDEVYPWIFNLADAALCVGIVILFVVAYFGGRRDAQKDK